MGDELTVKVQTPLKTVWEGKASAVSSVNSEGPFDVLPEHAKMITIINGSPITVVTGGVEKTFTFTKAVLSVREDTVSIYADLESAEDPETLAGGKEAPPSSAAPAGPPQAAAPRS